MKVASDTQSTVTIALLTFNGGELLKRLVDAVRTQETSRTLQFIAVDSGSTDKTRDVLGDAGFSVTTIPSESFNFGSTRDHLYTLATNDYVVNLSQDAIPAHDGWLENLITPLDGNEKMAASCGRSVPDEQRHYSQFPWEKNGYFYFTREMQRFSSTHGKGLSFSNSAVRRSVWEDLRFQPIVLSEDFQFQIALQKEGWSIAFPHDAQVLHHHDYNVDALTRRCKDEGAALRALGCPYSFNDCLSDWLHYRKNLQWLREIKYRRLHSRAAWLFPVLRPWAVYQGSKSAVRKE